MFEGAMLIGTAAISFGPMLVGSGLFPACTSYSGSAWSSWSPFIRSRRAEAFRARALEGALASKGAADRLASLLLWTAVLLKSNVSQSPSTRKYSSAMSFCHPPPVSSISSFWFSSPGQQLRHTGRPGGRPDRPGRRYGTAAKGKARCPCPAGDGLGLCADR